MVAPQDLPDDDALDPRQEQLIYSLLREKGKNEAARKAGIPLTTMYRWFKHDRKFVAAYGRALRAEFEEGLATLQKGFAKATQILVEEMDANSGARTGDKLIVDAATRVVDRAFKAVDAVVVLGQLNKLEDTVRVLQAAQNAPALPPAAPAEEAMTPVQERKGMTDIEQAEACRLRVEWMTEMGHGSEDIHNSLKFNRPQSVAEEQNLLDLAVKLNELDRMQPPES